MVPTSPILASGSWTTLFVMRIVYHVSRLKSQSCGARCCGLCDDAALDDIRHLVLQCARRQDQRIAFFDEIDGMIDIN